MKMKLFAFVAALVFFGASAQATERVIWNVTLTQVYPLSNGDFVLAFSADAPNCTNTSVPKYLFVAVGQNGITAAGSVKMYAAALTAFSTGRTVDAAFDDATPSCYINRLTIHN